MAARLTKTSRTLRGESSVSVGVCGASGEMRGFLDSALCASLGMTPVVDGAVVAPEMWFVGLLGAVAGVHEEVDVALAVAELGVFEAVVLVGQGEHGLGEEGDAGLLGRGGDVDGELAGAGAHEVAADADVVAEVEELVEGEGVLADVVFADVDLEALAVLLELGEAGLALEADGHDASGDGDFFAVGFELLA